MSFFRIPLFSFRNKAQYRKKTSPSFPAWSFFCTALFVIFLFFHMNAGSSSTATIRFSSLSPSPQPS